MFRHRLKYGHHVVFSWVAFVLPTCALRLDTCVAKLSDGQILADLIHALNPVAKLQNIARFRTSTRATCAENLRIIIGIINCQSNGELERRFLLPMDPAAMLSDNDPYQFIYLLELIFDYHVARLLVPKVSSLRKRLSCYTSNLRYPLKFLSTTEIVRGFHDGTLLCFLIYCFADYFCIRNDFLGETFGKPCTRYQRMYNLMCAYSYLASRDIPLLFPPQWVAAIETWDSKRHSSPRNVARDSAIDCRTTPHRNKAHSPLRQGRASGLLHNLNSPTQKARFSHLIRIDTKKVPSAFGSDSCTLGLSSDAIYIPVDFVFLQLTIIIEHLTRKANSDTASKLAATVSHTISTDNDRPFHSPIVYTFRDFAFTLRIPNMEFRNRQTSGICHCTRTTRTPHETPELLEGIVSECLYNGPATSEKSFVADGYVAESIIAKQQMSSCAAKDNAVVMIQYDIYGDHSGYCSANHEVLQAGAVGEEHNLIYRVSVSLNDNATEEVTMSVNMRDQRIQFFNVKTCLLIYELDTAEVYSVKRQPSMSILLLPRESFVDAIMRVKLLFRTTMAYEAFLSVAKRWRNSST